MHSPIAIIGASCRFPGATSLKEYWDLLSAGRHAIREIGTERWSTRFFGHSRFPEPGKSYSWAAGTLDAVDTFDAAFFGISAREAEQMDPQQRLMLELAWETLEDAGIPSTSLKGKPVGVYVGASGTEYLNLRFGDPSSADPYFMTGNTLSIFSNRISYILDLHGPSLTIDTACSSSLVALHVACEDIRSGRVPMALVGGVNLLLSPYPFIGFSQARMLSRSGRCFSFDARADGYVRGEGGGAALLKPLDRALADGNRVRGVILASGTNSDGRTIGLSLPNQTSQEALLRSVYAEAEIDPEDLAFVEAHGTGTAAGDPIEASAIGKALGLYRSQPLYIGSAKTNLGHLEAASGFAGLFKTMLALEHGTLPKSLNFEKPNPAIDFKVLNLRVAADQVTLSGSPKRGVAGVSGFGFGGTNAHLIISAAPAREGGVKDPPKDRPPPLLLSARSPEALRDLAARWQLRLTDADAETQARLARSTARQRDHHAHRLAITADPRTGLQDFLTGGQGPSTFVEGTAKPAAEGLAFVFSGNGAQWAGMGREVLLASSPFHAALSDVDLVLGNYLGWSVLDALKEGRADIARTDVAQPLLFAIQVAIVGVLRDWGIEAKAMFGHSVGEIAAAWASGILSLDDAAFLVVTRSRHQQLTAGKGRMAVVRATPGEILDAASAIGASIEIAAYNTPKSLTVAGSLEALNVVGKEARRRGLPFSVLDLDYAFHSAAMEDVREHLIADLARLKPRQGQIAFISTVEGGLMNGAELGPDYWWRNIRDPVRFADAASALMKSGTTTFIEIGPSAVLQSYLRDLLEVEDCSGEILPSLLKTGCSIDPFPAIAAACYIAGYPWWTAPIFDGSTNGVDLPTYPWQRERHWIRFTSEAMDLINPSSSHWLLGFRWRADANQWFNHLDTDTYPWLSDHEVGDSIVLPAAAIIDGALAAAKHKEPGSRLLELRDLEIRRPVLLGFDQTRELRFNIEPHGQFNLSSRSRFSDDAWTAHASGRVDRLDATSEILAETRDLRSKSQSVIHKEALYRAAARLGLHYGKEFQVVEKVCVFSNHEAWAEFKSIERIPGSLIDPRLLDGALQGLLGLLSDRVASDGHLIMLPWRFDRVRFSTEALQPVSAHLRIRTAMERAVVADLVLFDANGKVAIMIDGCWLQPVQIDRRRTLDQDIFRFTLSPAPLERVRLDIDATQGSPRSAAEKPGEMALLAEAFIASSAYESIAAVIGIDHEFSMESLVRLGEIASEAAPLLTSLLDLLSNHGAAIELRGSWKLASDAELADAGGVWRSLFYDAPGSPAVPVLLAWAAAHLKDYLVHGSAAKEEPPQALLDQLLFGGDFVEQLALSILAEVETVIRSHTEARTWRILDLDAGGGMLARKLLPRVEALAVDYQYVLGATSETLPRCLEAVSAWPAAQARLWALDDLSKDLNSQGFDIVISGQWLSAGSTNPSSLPALRSLLLPGGILIAAEPEPNPILNFVFGLHPEWWLSGLQPNLPAGHLLQAGDWERLFDEAGFDGFQATRIAEDPWPLVLFRGKRPLDFLQVANLRGTIVLAGGQQNLALALRRAFEKDHISSVRANTKDLRRLLADTNKATVVLLPFDGVEDTGDLANHIFVAADAAIAAHAVSAELVLVCRGSASGNTTGLTSVEHALTGIGRVAANEMPELQCRRINISAEMSDSAAADCLARELRAGAVDREVSWTSNGRFVPRLRRGLPKPSLSKAAFKLVQDEPGFLDSLSWEQTNRLDPAAREVTIEVQAAGLNFRDVMWAMALLPGEALLDGFAGPSLGMECAGIVAAVGAEVDQFKVGDRVMAFAPAAFSSHVATLASCVSSIPATIDFASATTMPVAFITVLYALGTLGRLRAGETVLIHGGAGGVGLAAIQYAQHIGANVIATAGSTAKRAMLRLTGVAHVLDSRSLAFADEVMQLTGGRGVDVVLNSLSGDAMEKSLRLMAPFGRFLELGKRDFYESTRVSVRPFRHNVSYFAIDADELVARRPDIAAATMTELRDLLQNGMLRPLPHIKLDFGQVADAFRLMRSSGHIGKIVLMSGQVAARSKRTAEQPLFDVGKTLVVTGGMTGFGLATVRWFVQSGAKHVAVLSRRGDATPGYPETAIALKIAGATTVRCFACDVADEAALSVVLNSIRDTMPPIGAVVHAAMVIEDSLLAGLTRPEIERVLQPKLGGAAALDRLTRQDPIELFVLFSSATTLLGAPGQASYVAANMALEALAAQRQTEGLPGIAVGWGPIADAGYLAERPAARDALARRLGAVPLSAEYALSSLPALVRSGLAAVAFAEVDWTVAKGSLPILAEPMFSSMSAVSLRSDAIETNESFIGKTPEQIIETVQGVLIDEIAIILRVARSALDPNRPLTEVGMDSLMAVELKLGVERRLRLEFPAFALNESVTVVSMAKRLAARLGEAHKDDDALDVLLQHEDASGPVGALAEEVTKSRMPERVNLS